jgi:acyl-coenzyme A thioesterase PaaI-like protein
VAPPLTVEVVDRQMIGRATFGEAYEGPPGCVHGGFIAACFDDVLGMVQAGAGDLGMTGTLSVRYLAPTPLHRELRFIGTLAGIDGRKVTTRGELWVGDVRTAEAEALFITVGAERFRQMRSRQQRPDGSLPIAP